MNYSCCRCISHVHERGFIAVKYLAPYHSAPPTTSPSPWSIDRPLTWTSPDLHHLSETRLRSPLDEPLEHSFFAPCFSKYPSYTGAATVNPPPDSTIKPVARPAANLHHNEHGTKRCESRNTYPARTGVFARKNAGQFIFSKQSSIILHEVKYRHIRCKHPTVADTYFSRHAFVLNAGSVTMRGCSDDGTRSTRLIEYSINCSIASQLDTATLSREKQDMH